MFYENLRSDHNLTIRCASFTMFYENLRSDHNFYKLLNRPNLCILLSKNGKKSGKVAEKSGKNGLKNPKGREKNNTIFCGNPSVVTSWPCFPLPLKA